MSQAIIGYSSRRGPNRRDEGGFQDYCPESGELLPAKRDEWVLLDAQRRELSATVVAKRDGWIKELIKLLNEKIGALLVNFPSPSIIVDGKPSNTICREDNCGAPLKRFRFRKHDVAIGFVLSERIGADTPSQFHAMCEKHNAKVFPVLDGVLRHFVGEDPYVAPMLPPLPAPTAEQVLAQRRERRRGLLYLFLIGGVDPNGNPLPMQARLDAMIDVLDEVMECTGTPS